MENETIMVEWRYDFAWKGRDIAQEANDRLDSKAMNIINFAGLLIPIISGVLFFVIEKSPTQKLSQYMLLASMVLLIISIILALLTIWGRNQGIIRTIEHFDKSKEKHSNDYLDTLGYTTGRLGNWQIQILKIGDYKYKCFFISSLFFVFALLLIIFSVLLTFSPN